MKYKPIDFSSPLFFEEKLGERIFFTKHGRKQLARRFAEVGVNISDIRTKDQALAAIKESEKLNFEQIVNDGDADSKVKAVFFELINDDG